MRMTTQMLDISAKKTGLPYTQGNSLLDYVNNSQSGSGNTLLDALNKSSKNSNGFSNASGYSNGDISTLLGALNKTNYEKLGKKAEDLSSSAEMFQAQGTDSVFEKAKESGDQQAIYQGLENLISDYNETIKALQGTGDPLHAYYRQMLGEAASENAEALKSIGVSIAKDGTLSLDKSTMKKADLESLEKVLGVSGTFTKKTAFVASRISENAQANAQSVSSQYDVTGNLYTASASKYDFRG